MKRKTEKKGGRWKFNTPPSGITGHTTVPDGQEKLVSGAREGIMGLREKGGNNGKINERMKLTT